MRSVLFAALAFVFPHELKSGAHPLLERSKNSRAQVSVSIDSFEPVLPQRAYDHLIEEAAAIYHVDPTLIRSVMQAESAFNPWALSRAGAMGLMQLMPNIAAAFDVEHPFDPRENIMAGTRLLRELLDQHRGNLALTLASYNAGAGVVAQYGAVPPFEETRKYVNRVRNLIAAANND
jgi:soluble lytic murein transglycosylase-like protein